MTDKIIIDGVDVSKCCYLRYDHIGCDIDQTYCLGNDCCYKQLKRKEQECEELKEKQKELLHDCNSCKFHQYKQALDEIEKIVSADYYDDSWGTLAIKIDSIKEIINKAKAVSNAR